MLKTVVPQVRKQGMVLNNSAFLILFLTGAISSRKQCFHVVKIHSVNDSLLLFKPFDEKDVIVSVGVHLRHLIIVETDSYIIYIQHK